MKVKDFMLSEQENSAFYEGHLPDSGVQKHSAGNLYPVIMVTKGVEGNYRHGYMYCGYVDWYITRESALQMATTLKKVHTEQGHATALSCMKELSQGVKLYG